MAEKERWIECVKKKDAEMGGNEMRAICFLLVWLVRQILIEE